MSTSGKKLLECLSQEEDNAIGGLIDSKGAVLHEDKKKASYLFNRLFGKADDTHTPTVSATYCRSQDHITQLEDLDKPITIKEITKALMKLGATGKSADYDEVYPKVLKQGIILHLIFNKVLESHQWPFSGPPQLLKVGSFLFTSNPKD